MFQFDANLNASTNVDEILDFNAAEGDQIALAANVFGAFAPAEIEDGYALNAALKSTAFKLGTSATTDLHRIIYNQSTDALYYDADGIGSSFAQVQFAQLKAGTVLSAAHFQMFTL